MADFELGDAWTLRIETGIEANRKEALKVLFIALENVASILLQPDPENESSDDLLFEKAVGSKFIESYLLCPSEQTAALFALLLVLSLTTPEPSISIGWAAQTLDWDELSFRMSNLRYQDFLVLYSLVKAKITLVEEEEVAGSVHRLLYNGLMYPLAGREIESPTSIASYMVPSPYGIYLCSVIDRHRLIG